jgi:hypothetical protein
MKTLSALGVIAGGFLMSPPPKAVITTLLWVVARSNPVVSTMVILAVLSAWKSRDD